MYDCIIAGGGPAGLSAAVTLNRRGKTPLVLTAGETLLRRAEQVDNYLGMPGVTGAEMMDTFVRHAESLGVEIRAGRVGNILPFDGHFMVNADGDILEAKTVLLATGAARSTPVPGEADFLGRGVSYCATCDGMLYRGRKVVVWGLSVDAPHEAAFLAKIGCQVTYIAAKRPEELADGIRFIPGRIAAVRGEAAVTGVEAAGGVVETDAVFVLRQSAPPDAILPGLAFENGAVTVDRACRTNIEGVYAAGDLTGTPLQVSKAVGEGLTAALSIVEYLDKK